jgi:predicted phage gp36 major capsid-like protein
LPYIAQFVYFRLDVAEALLRTGRDFITAERTHALRSQHRRAFARAGFPVAEAEDMLDIDDDSFSIAFGDFRRGYLVVDRLGVRVLRDPYSAKPYLLFYVTKRVGGGVADFDAIKLMKFAAAA